MGLEDVKNEIIQEAKQEKQQIISEAEERRDELISEAEEKAESIREETDKEIEEKKEALRKKTESNANMEAKKIKLDAKQDAIQRVFRKFREELEELDADERENFVENAVEEVDFEVGKIQGSSEFSDAASGHDFEEIDEQGIILISENGERRVNYTIDRIVQDFKENYRKKIAEKLFE